MSSVRLKPFVSAECRRDLHPRSDADLSTIAGCTSVVNELLETPPDELANQPLGLLNLMCAGALSGSESLHIPDCMARLHRLTEFVRAATERNARRAREHPEYGNCEPMWRMASLVTLVKRDYGATYNPIARDDLHAGIEAPFNDSRDVFIHGLLDDDPNHRWGTCTSIPTLVGAVARNLGYPVHLVVMPTHVFARWDGDGLRFNIEASNPMGMTVQPDSDYRELRGGFASVDDKHGFFLRTLSAAEEFALFMNLRVRCLLDCARYDETLLWAARALQFAPDEPRAPQFANFAMDLALKSRFRQLHPDRPIPPSDAPLGLCADVGELLRIEERCLFFTILAHLKESQGAIAEARALFENAARQNFHGNNEQRDLQRFLRQHNSPRKSLPLMPPDNLGFPRRITVFCSPQLEAHTLRALADQFERGGELLKARDALHDLYMFDPSDAEVFHRARSIEQRPQFQERWAAAVAERRRALQAAGLLPRPGTQK